MSVSTAELVLVMRAQDLASGAVDSLHGSLETLRTKVQAVSSAFATSFKNMASSVGVALPLVAEQLARNGNIPEAAATLGVIAAGSFVTTLGGMIIEQLAGSAFIQGIAATLAAVGSSIGGLIAAAIPVGMALLPALLVAAVVAAVVFLATHPEVRAKVFEVAGNIIHWLIDRLAALPGLLFDVFKNAVGFVATSIVPLVAGLAAIFLNLPQLLVGLGLALVKTIVGGMASLPGKVANVIRDAFSHLHIDVGPFHISGKGITIDLPKIDLGPNAANAGKTYEETHGYSQHAAGGWVGLHGPELGILGEKGPEYVIPNSALRGAGGGRGDVRIVGVTIEQITDMVDRGLYFRLQRASASLGRT